MIVKYDLIITVGKFKNYLKGVFFYYIYLKK